MLRTETITSAVSTSKGHSLLYRSVHVTQTLPSPQSSGGCVYEHFYYTISFASHGNLVKQVGEGLLLFYFVGGETEAQRREVASLKALCKLGAPKTAKS